MRKWSNVPGATAVELYRDFDSFELVRDVDDDVMLPEELLEWLAPRVEDWAELVIEWTSSGYYRPGQLCGPPERCYPSESEDERTVQKAVLHTADDSCDVPSELLGVIAGWWHEEIHDTELDGD